MIQYYVTYTASQPEGFTHGSVVISRKFPFYDIHQILEAQKIIEDENYMNDVIITSWTKFERKPFLLILKQLFVHPESEVSNE